MEVKPITNIQTIFCGMLLLMPFGAPARVGDDPFETNESRLFEHLFNPDYYDSTTRPVRNKSNPVQVSLDVALVQLIDLVWVNELLKWNPDDFGGIKSLVVDKKNVWTPDIVLYNNAKNGKHRGSIDQFKTRVEMTSTGTHKWYIPAILTSSCSIDITYFPFDIQKCELKFGSWTYLGHEINLTNYRETADIKAYLPSSSFYLREAKAIRNVVYYTCCPDPYVDVTFELLLERQPGYYVYNVIVPSLVVTSFALLNFMFPDVTGSRMGLVFDCFLAITVTYMMVSDMLPVSSDTMPLISKFMLFCMTQMVLAVIASAVSMRMRVDTPVPKLVRKIVINKLAPLFCVTQNFCMKKKPKHEKDENLNSTNTADIKRKQQIRKWQYGVRSTNETEQESYEMLDTSTDNFSDSSGYPETSDSSASEGKRRKGALWDCFSSGFNSLTSTILPEQSDLQCLQDLDSLIAEQKRLIEDCNTKDFWRCVSQVADRIFLLSFFITWVIMVAVFFINTPYFDTIGA